MPDPFYALQVVTPETALRLFQGGRRQGERPLAILLPPWIPHAVCLCKEFEQIPDGSKLLNHCTVISNLIIIGQNHRRTAWGIQEGSKTTESRPQGIKDQAWWALTIL
jgi:hypothetical protein